MTKPLTENKDIKNPNDQKNQLSVLTICNMIDFNSKHNYFHKPTPKKLGVSK